MRVGFIGLGTMGQHMARHVIEAGHDVTVHDLDESRAEEHVAAGATWAPTPAATAAGADVILTSLPGPAEVEAVALGGNGLADGFEQGAAWFDLTTNSPTLIRRLHDELGTRGVSVLDCPVSGGPVGARTKKLALWVGGDEEVYRRHLSLLEDIGDQPAYIGPIGSGAVAKLVHNCAGYTIQAALAEVFTMAAKAGCDPLTIWRAVRQGALGRQRTFERLGDRFLPGEYDTPSFALRLAHKDVGLACEVGREHGVPMRLSELTLADMTEALNRGWGERDSRSVLQLQTERSAVEIKVPREAIRQVREQDDS